MKGLVLLLRCRTWRHNILAGFAGLALGSLLGCALILWANHLAPVVVREVHELDGVAPLKGHLDFYVNLDRNRDCPSETSRWLWTWVDHNGEKIKQFYPLLNTATTLTDFGRDQHFILSIPVPPGIWPGQWFYFSKTVEHCSILPSLFRSAIRESSDVPVRIVDEAP